MPEALIQWPMFGFDRADGQGSRRGQLQGFRQRAEFDLVAGGGGGSVALGVADGGGLDPGIHQTLPQKSHLTTMAGRGGGAFRRPSELQATPQMTE